MKFALCTTTIVVFLSTGLPSHASVPHHPPCRDLPAPAWHGSSKVTLTALGIPLSVPAAAGVKSLYQQALCGDDPGRLWGLAESGQGELITIRSSLALGLHSATPHFPRVDHAYVRGGGLDRPMIVILFANGYDGPLFVTDGNLAWTEAEAQRAAGFWNALPYEYVRRASRWLHDVAKYRTSYTVVLKGSVLGILPFEIPIVEMANRAMANPLGSMLMPSSNIGRDAEVWVHELAHYNHYEIAGLQPLLYAGEFGSISRRNATLLGVKIPGVFKEKNATARDEREEHCGGSGSSQLPYGYVTWYAYCGEASILEDFADTLSVAIGVSQGVVRAREDGISTPDFSRYENSGSRRGYSPELLFSRLGTDRDSATMTRKANFLFEQFTLSTSSSMDADGDGQTWFFGDPFTNGDCADHNPAIGPGQEERCNGVDDDCDGSIDEGAC